MRQEDVDVDWEELAHNLNIEIQPVAEEILEYLGATETVPGLIALCKLPQLATADWNVEDLLLVLDGIGDPGNVGTLIRAADAAGAGGVLLTENSADAFNPKAVRATAGSIFNLPPIQLAQRTPDAAVAALQARNIPIIAAVAHEGRDCFRYRWPRRCALVLGHETRGISPALEAAATARITIPIYGRAESLNVAMAGAVLLYAWRQSIEAF
ncbi:MAG: RNA methyltransferase [Abitibacteriaceae bacterium]|nr:RNA methyltransferase [Abditibacteriaceae bacterium]